MKYRIIITAIVSIFILASNANATMLTGDISNAAAKQVEQMIADFKAQDLEKASKYIVEPSNDTKKKSVENYNSGIIQKISKGEFNYSVIDSKVSGKWAVVAVKVERNLDNNGEPVKSGWLRNETLYKDGDQWMIIPQAIRNHDPKVESWKNNDYKIVMDWWSYEARKTISQRHVQNAKARLQNARQKPNAK